MAESNFFSRSPAHTDRLCFFSGGVAENTKMNDCFYEKKDWRVCKNEVSANCQRLGKFEFWGRSVQQFWRNHVGLRIGYLIEKKLTYCSWRTSGNAGRSRRMTRGPK